MAATSIQVDHNVHVIGVRCAMNKGLRSGLRHAAVCRFLFCTTLAYGQNAPSVTEKTIVIGSCSALEGPSHSLGVETVAGANAYFTLTNDKGGVHGRKLKLIAYDDSYDPAKTEPCVTVYKVFAMGFFVGTPTAVKYVPLAESNKMPVIGLFRGAQTLYTPLRHWIVNVRASYYDETREQLDGVWNKLGYHTVGVIYPEDAFGTAVLGGVTEALKAYGAEPVKVASYERQTASVGDPISTVRAANPQAVVVVGPPNTVAQS
jgi:ABC-type branched-subunit amino acid transport system substrate-binding protein